MTLLPEIQRALVAAAEREERGTRRSRAKRARPIAVLLVGVLAATGVAVGASRVLNNGPGQFPTQYRFGTCPTNVTSLPSNAIAQAKRAAVDQAPAAYPHRDLRGVRATRAEVVTYGTARSADAGRCRLYGRTVLVDLFLPAPFHSASLSEGAVYVSYIAPAHGPAYWELWGVEH